MQNYQEMSRKIYFEGKILNLLLFQLADLYFDNLKKLNFVSEKNDILFLYFFYCYIHYEKC